MCCKAEAERVRAVAEEECREAAERARECSHVEEGEGNAAGLSTG